MTYLRPLGQRERPCVGTAAVSLFPHTETQLAGSLTPFQQLGTSFLLPPYSSSEVFIWWLLGVEGEWIGSTPTLLKCHSWIFIKKIIFPVSSWNLPSFLVFGPHPAVLRSHSWWALVSPCSSGDWILVNCWESTWLAVLSLRSWKQHSLSKEIQSCSLPNSTQGCKYSPGSSLNPWVW